MQFSKDVQESVAGTDSDQGRATRDEVGEEA